MRTDLNAMAAVYAFLFIPHDFCPDQLTFRVGTPFAAEGTAFQKNNGPDPGPVIDGKLLDIEYNASVVHIDYLTSIE